ncbi:hypothetical protein M2447_002732 [Ereboglobus sp. PH5-10]|uniref:DUF1998 domain-containing protein n=1 Tax=Ereboglobus sp. PH5-10 TaxID=2940629 RepID=UPI002406542B|nr:DUF1998 domain-containing protein [Ereboglobus sp. PH5-10]MDF9828605.1 hypothetical protein [Ereboglobus sp. PH5-10]
MTKLLPVGSVRPSQLLWTYGPGALVDLPNLSVVTMGLDRWDASHCAPIDEKRLLDAVRKQLGAQVERLRMPPVSPSEGVDMFSREAKIGVPVRPFPRWLRCVKCGTLAEFDSGLFDIKENPYRPEDTRFVHKTCEKGKNADAVPARFLLACRNGHLDDFPWRYYVHDGPSDCKGTLSFFEQGASLQTENLWVKCTCGKARSLVHAFGRDGAKNLPACRGRHPHLNHYDKCCDQQPRAVLLGSTNSWFSMSISVLSIPSTGNLLEQLVADGWTYFEDVEDINELKPVLKTLVKTGQLPGIEAHPFEEIWAQIQNRKGGKGADTLQAVDIKRPEWEVLTNPAAPNDWPHFMTSKTAAPSEYTSKLGEVLLLERLKEVNALIGFTRVEAPEESDDPDDRPPMADLCRGAPTWVPAFEVHGEGIFIRFREDAIHQWMEKPAIRERDTMLLAGHRGWRHARQLVPDNGYPGIRYAMLHTFSHLLIRELALECGYNTASIRERIYADSDPEKPMAGILLYTAAADSDGTLGGLVELGKPETLGRLITQALRRASICSSDPLCSEHDPRSDRSLHGASCHGCSFVAETSCERGNRYLDRALVTGTFDDNGAAFFDIPASSNG